MSLAEDPNLRRLYAVRLFMVRCILPDGYHFPSALGEAIHLTAPGELILRQVMESNSALSMADAKAAVFAEFAGSDSLLIDHEQTKYEELQAALTDDIRKTVIKYPWVYGDVLEATYIEIYGREARQYLNHEETISVLTRLPQGVFQVADVTVGPFGMLNVIQQRCVPPSLCGPEISCIDPGCTGIHHVLFSTGETDASKAFMSITSAPLSEAIQKLIDDLVRPQEQRYRPDNDWSFPWLVMSGITPAESRNLLAKLLETNIDGVREFANTHLHGSPRKKSAAEISLKVTDAEMCQMFMTVTNESLINAMEEMIETNEIEVGRTETRMPIRSRHAEGGYFRTKPQISRLGVRFLPKDGIAPLRLRAFILQLYRGEAQKELAWLLRDQPGETVTAQLDNFLLNSDTEHIIIRLVMGTRERVLDAFRLLHYGRFSLPTNPASDAALTEKVLWKLGNDLTPPPSADRAVMDRIRVFRRVSSQEKDRNEDSIDSIRSAGIVMFVALESLIANLVDYVCWMLLSDHYSANRRMRFVYRAGVARSFTRPLLSSRNRQGAFEFDVNGDNSLGTLITSLRLIVDICEETLAAGSEFVRDASYIPFVSVYSGIYNFPFRHTKLILDIEPNDAAAVLSALRSAASELERAAAVHVRNRLGHPKETFPSDDDVNRSCLGVEAALEILQLQGLLPIVYMRVSQHGDAFGRRSATMSDGNSRYVGLAVPSDIGHAGMPALNRPQFIVTGVHPIGSSQPLRLAYVEETKFTELLDAYAPLRASGSTAESDAVTSEPEERTY
jgi:hypothetical protein